MEIGNQCNQIPQQALDTIEKDNTMGERARIHRIVSWEQ
jgi:hypothetical protein